MEGKGGNRQWRAGGWGCRRSWRGGRRGWRRAAAVVTDGRGTDAYAALLLGQRDWRRWLYPALPRHGSGRGRAFPRQRSAVMVAATSGLCRAAMHGAAQAFGRARAIGAAKSVSLKKIDNVRFKIILKKG